MSGRASSNCAARAALRSKTIACCAAMTSPRRWAFTSCGTASAVSCSIVPATVPGSREYSNTPTASNCCCFTNSTSSAWSAAVSPGKPEMNVVRIAMPGTRVRSLSSSLSVAFRVVWRFIALSMRSLACCSGMSMYGRTRGLRAISSMRASLTFVG